jgi:hypothetical protein
MKGTHRLPGRFRFFAKILISTKGPICLEPINTLMLAALLGAKDLDSNDQCGHHSPTKKSAKRELIISAVQQGQGLNP